MAAKAEKFIPAVVQLKPIFFTCKFCGESKPLQDLIVIRRFYPQLTACSECARSKRIIETDAAPSDTTA
jgi:transcription elongation factor Elf1